MYRPADILEVTRPVVPLVDLQPDMGDIRAEVLAGLAGRPRSLPSKLFYDESGSRLFERITAQPEYYQTRTEIGLLQRHATEIARRLGPGADLIEYGSGSSVKTRLLLEALEVRRYIPIDISRWSLVSAARRLMVEFPELVVAPVVADYTQPVALPAELEGANRIGFFPGGTIGNFVPEEAEQFLSRFATTLGRGGRLLIGVDLKKEPNRLHAAYNDAQGVTAAFNRNILHRMNRELEADFDVSRWDHYAFYNPLLGRIEMHLLAAGRQVVHVAGRRFVFDLGEGIHTENSYKYTPEGFAALARRGGMAVETVWVDDERLFSVQLLRVAS